VLGGFLRHYNITRRHLDTSLTCNFFNITRRHFDTSSIYNYKNCIKKYCLLLFLLYHGDISEGCEGSSCVFVFVIGLIKGSYINSHLCLWLIFTIALPSLDDVKIRHKVRYSKYPRGILIMISGSWLAFCTGRSFQECIGSELDPDSVGSGELGSDFF
jgi:hypothetical protein